MTFVVPIHNVLKILSVRFEMLTNDVELLNQLTSVRELFSIVVFYEIFKT